MTDQPDWLKNYTPDHRPATKWGPGVSGNPKGRPVGSKNHKTELAQAFHDQGGAIANVVINAALEGDLRACELVLARLAPPLRARAEKVVFQISPDGSLTDQARNVLQAISQGLIDPATGQMLINAISTFGGLKEVDELRARLDCLEARSAPSFARVGYGGVLAVESVDGNIP